MSEVNRDNLYEWNKRIYGDSPEHLQADWFWEKLGIKSFPLFQGECWSHIPKSWEGPVEKAIKTIQARYPNKVDFIQIKEKFIYLTVYYSTDSGIRSEVEAILETAREELRGQGLHI